MCGRFKRTQTIGEMVLELICCPLSEQGLATHLGSRGAVMARVCSRTPALSVMGGWKASASCFLFPLVVIGRAGIMSKLVAATRKLFQLLIAITLLLISKYDYASLSRKDLLGFNI